MNNIIIKNKGYLELTPKSGYLITSYHDGDNILEYYSTTEVCTPIDLDISTIYRSVTLEQDSQYKAEKETAQKEYEEAKKKIKEE